MLAFCLTQSAPSWVSEGEKNTFIKIVFKNRVYTPANPNIRMPIIGFRMATAQRTTDQSSGM